jgi:hypothetical protein
MNALHAVADAKVRQASSLAIPTRLRRHLHAADELEHARVQFPGIAY